MSGSPRCILILSSDFYSHSCERHDFPDHQHCHPTGRNVDPGRLCCQCRLYPAAAAEASTSFAAAADAADAAASSRATSANAQIETALGQITTSVSRTVAGLETNVSTLVAATGGTGDGSTPKNAGATCTQIKAAYRSSSNGYYYVDNPVNLSRTDSTAHLFGEQGPSGASVLKVYCNFASEDLCRHVATW